MSKRTLTQRSAVCRLAVVDLISQLIGINIKIELVFSSTVPYYTHLKSLSHFWQAQHIHKNCHLPENGSFSPLLTASRGESGDCSFPLMRLLFFFYIYKCMFVF